MAVKNDNQQINERVESMSDVTLNRLMEYLTKKGWSNDEIVKLIKYLTAK